MKFEAFNSYVTLNASPTYKFRISNSCQVWYESSNNMGILKQTNKKSAVIEAMIVKLISEDVFVDFKICMSDQFDWLLCKQQMGRVSLHIKSSGSRKEKKKASGISIQIIMSATAVCHSLLATWPRNYSISSSIGALCALGLSIKGNTESGCLYIHWWHNFLSKVTLNLQRGGSRYLPTIRL